MKHHHKMVLVMIYLIVISLFSFYFSVYMDLSPEQRNEDLFGRSINFLLNEDAISQEEKEIILTRSENEKQFLEFANTHFSDSEHETLKSQYNMLKWYANSMNPVKILLQSLHYAKVLNINDYFSLYAYSEDFVDTGSAKFCDQFGVAQDQPFCWDEKYLYNCVETNPEGNDGKLVLTSPCSEGCALGSSVCNEDLDQAGSDAAGQAFKGLLDGDLTGQANRLPFDSRGSSGRAKYVNQPTISGESYIYVDKATNKIKLHGHFQAALVDSYEVTYQLGVDEKYFSCPNSECIIDYTLTDHQVANICQFGHGFYIGNPTGNWALFRDTQDSQNHDGFYVSSANYLHSDPTISHNSPTDVNNFYCLNGKPHSKDVDYSCLSDSGCFSGLCKSFVSPGMFGSVKQCVPCGEPVSAYFGQLGFGSYGPQECNDGFVCQEGVCQPEETTPQDPDFEPNQNQSQSQTQTLSGNIYVKEENGQLYLKSKLANIFDATPALSFTINDLEAPYQSAMIPFICDEAFCEIEPVQLPQEYNQCELILVSFYEADQKFSVIALNHVSNLDFTSSDWSFGIPDSTALDANILCDEKELLVNGLPFGTDGSSDSVQCNQGEIGTNQGQYHEVTQDILLCNDIYELSQSIVITATQDNPVTFNCNGATLTWDQENTQSSNYLIDILPQTNHVTIKNCNFESQYRAVHTVGAQNIALLNNKFTNIEVPLFVESTVGLLLKDNTFENLNDYPGDVLISNSQFVLAKGNTFANKGLVTIDGLNSQFITLENNQFQLDRFKVENSENTILYLNDFQEIPDASTGMVFTLTKSDNAHLLANHFRANSFFITQSEGTIAQYNTYDLNQQHLNTNNADKIVFYKEEGIKRIDLKGEGNAYTFSIPTHKVKNFDNTRASLYFDIIPVVARPDGSKADFAEILVKDVDEDITVYRNYVYPGSDLSRNSRSYYGYTKELLGGSDTEHKYEILVNYNNKKYVVPVPTLQVFDDKEVTIVVKDTCVAQPADVISGHYLYMFDEELGGYQVIAEQNSVKYEGFEITDDMNLCQPISTQTPEDTTTDPEDPVNPEPVDVAQGGTCTKHTHCLAGLVCDNGICSTPDFNQQCYDSDGFDGLVTGQVVDQSEGLLLDYCLDDNTVFENICSPWADNEIIICNDVLEGSVCVDGACVIPQQTNDPSKQCGDLSECPQGAECISFGTKNMCLFPNTQIYECSTNNDCLPTQNCIKSVTSAGVQISMCIDSQNTNPQNPPMSCTSDDECEAGFACIMDLCLEQGDACEINADCPIGYFCEGDDKLCTQYPPVQFPECTQEGQIVTINCASCVCDAQGNAQQCDFSSCDQPEEPNELPIPTGDECTLEDQSNCQEGEVCFDGYCLETTNSCMVHADCEVGYFCDDNLCNKAPLFDAPECTQEGQQVLVGCATCSCNAQGQATSCNFATCDEPEPVNIPELPGIPTGSECTTLDLSNCAADQACFQGYCVDTAGACTSLNDCPNGFLCENNLCKKAPQIETPLCTQQGVQIKVDCALCTCGPDGATEFCDFATCADMIPKQGCTTNSDCGDDVCFEGSCHAACSVAGGCEEEGYICLDVSFGTDFCIEDGTDVTVCTSNADCSENQQCTSGVCQAPIIDPNNPDNNVCSQNSDCHAGQTCNSEGICEEVEILVCEQDSDCAVELGEFCLGGNVCSAQCTSENENEVCLANEVCSDAGVCIIPGTSCSSDSDCYQGHNCVDNLCVDPQQIDIDVNNDVDNNGNSGTGSNSGGSTGGSHHGNCDPIYPQSCFEEITSQPCVNGQRTIACEPLNKCKGVTVLEQICGTSYETTCFDGVRNQGERGIDCGGPCAKACVPLTTKRSEIKQPAFNEYVPTIEDSFGQATCFDGIQNQNEENIDCGGPCEACASCFDGIQNQGEDKVDCGGPCEACSSIPGWMWFIPLVILIALIGIFIIVALRRDNEDEQQTHAASATPASTILITKPKQKPTQTQPKTTTRNGLHNLSDIPAVDLKHRDFEPQLKHYIERELELGKSREHIVKNLSSAGWPVALVNKLFDKEVHTFMPKQYEQQVKKYIDFYVRKGLSLAQIEKKLVSAGWDRKTIDHFMNQL